MPAGTDPPAFVPDGYRVIHELGSGQTSRVYLTEHARYGSVALKIPRPELAQRPVLRRMFENEVQITLKLDHPRVVRAFAGHPTGPQAYLALEYCPGGTLDQLLLERGRMRLDRTLQLVLDVADGLKYTHGSRVLHRDVKPANVFLDEGGRAKLGDFGTGMFMAEDNDERVGTAFYMAPEIFEGAAASQESDVYSLGVLAYEVICGVRPFLGDSYDALMLAHLTGVPRDPRRYRDDMEPRVAKAVMRSMSRDPAKRFRTVDAFVSELREASNLHAPEEAASPEPPRVGRATRALDGSSGRRKGEAGGRGAAERASPDADAPGDAGDEQRKRPGLLKRLFGRGKD